ncbi:hypothetical protein LPJ62_001986 [Coemansia sp. RSA 2167]|nr:hypothetical protein LPJ62_001986 [Coemansia sp. RSA 2167]
MFSCSAGAMSEDLLAKHAVCELAATVSGEWQTADTAIASDEDESWLALNSDELDTVMRKAESVLHDAAQSDPASEFAADDDDRTAQDLQSMLAKFESFLAADSGIEGANVMNAHSDDEYAESSDEDVDLDADGIIGALMEALGAKELARTPKTSGTDDSESAPNHEDSDYELDDVNFDLNLVHNIIESFQAQEGLSGPAGTMLGQAGIRLPRSGNAGSENDANSNDAGGKSPAT